MVKKNRGTITMINEWLKTGLQCLSFIVSIWIGGFMFHEKIMSDLDRRIDKMPASFSKESGEEVKGNIQKLEDKMEKRFDKIEISIQDLMKFKSQTQTSLEKKDPGNYGFNNP